MPVIATHTARALILAAGDGDRLHPLTDGMPKPLLKLHHRPLLYHVLGALSEAGVGHATIVIGFEGARIRDALDSLRPPGMEVGLVENDAWQLGNARSIWAARDAVGAGPFVLAMADHIIDPAIARAVAAGPRDRMRLAVDRAAPGDPRADEATRALVDDAGRITDLGKGIPHWNALDTGIFWCTPRIFDVMAPPLRDGEAGAVFAALAREGALDAADVTGLPWIDVDTEEDLRHAATVLAAMRASERP